MQDWEPIKSPEYYESLDIDNEERINYEQWKASQQESEPEKVEEVEEVEEVVEWLPTREASYYESLPLMDKERASWEQWKQDKGQPIETVQEQDPNQISFQQAEQDLNSVRISKALKDESLYTDKNQNRIQNAYQRKEEDIEDWEVIDQVNPLTTKSNIIDKVNALNDLGYETDIVRTAGGDVEVKSVSKDGEVVFSDSYFRGADGLGDLQLSSSDFNSWFDTNIINDKRKDLYLQQLSTEEKEKDNIKYDGDKRIINQTVKDAAYRYLPSIDQEYAKLRDEVKQLREQGLWKEYERKKALLDKQRSLMNLGDYIYDDESGELISIKSATEEQKSNNSKREEDIKNIAKAYKVSDLENIQKNIYYQLRGVDDQIKRNKEEVDSEIPLSTLAFRSVANLFMPGSEVEDFKIYGNLKGKIPGNHPLAKKHNELIDKLYNVTRAIELNTNPMTVDEESALRDYQSAMSEIVFGEDVHAKRNFGTPGVPDQMAATFHETLKDYGLDVDQSILEKEVNKETFGDMASEGMAGLTPIVLSFGAARGMKIQGPNKQVGFKNFSDFMHKAGDVMKNSVGGGRSKIWNSVVNLNVMGAEEVGVAIIGNQLNKTVFNQEGLPLADAYLFGYGNSIARGIQTKIAKSTLPYFSDFSRTKPGIVLGTVATPVVGGVTATATAKGVEAVNIGISWLNGEKQSSIDEQLHHLLDMNRNLAEVMNFTVLGLRGPMYQRAKIRWQAVDAINGRTTKAANEFGIKQITLKQYEKLSPEEQGARVDEINRIADEKIKALMNKSNLVNQIETQNKIKEIDLNREILLNQNNILDTKIRIKKYDNSFISAETKLDAIANKIMSGEELALEDVSFLGEIGNEYINDKTNKSTGQVNVSNALNIISERLGFQKGTDQYKALETVLTNKSQVGQYIDFLAPDKADPFRKQTFDYLNETNNVRSKIAELESVPETSPSKPIAKAELEFQKSKLKELDNNYAEKFGEFKTNQANKLDLDIEFVKKNAEKAGVKEVLSLNDAAFKKAAAINGFSSTADGMYFKDRIYINRDKALETGAISVGSHEFLHALLKNSFKSKDGLLTAEGKKILNEFYEGLTQQQKNIIDDRLDIYRYENTRTPEGRIIYKTNSKGERILNKDFENRRLEEILNLFVDGFRTGKFNLNEGITAKLANVLKPVLNRLGKATSYDMSTVEGVRKFINDYAKSSKKGKIEDNLINELKKEESVVDTDQLVFASESFGKEFDKKADIDVTKQEWDAGGYDKAFKMVDEGILDGQIIQDVGKKKIPIRGEKIVIEGKEFTKREFIEDVRSEIKNVIRNFNPEVNESLLGWINNPKNFPNKRKVVFEAYEKIALGEKAARGEGVATEKLVPERPVEPIGAGRTESLKLLSASGRAELVEKIRTSIPEIPEVFQAYLNSFKNKLKDIPNLAAKELAKEIGIPENKITDPADNLSKSEAFKAQRWLMSNMNYAKAIDLMPFNNVPVFKEYAYKPGTTQKIRHPKSRKGENFIYISVADKAMLNQPTGLFGNIKRDFFTKTDQRIGNDFLWTKNEFSEKYFLEKVGIKDRKKAETFTQRTSEAQTLKGVLNYIAKDMTLKAMSEKADRLGLQNEVNNLRSGKNVYAASESYVSKLPEFVQHDFMSNRLSDIAREFQIRYNGSPKDAKEVKAVVDAIMKGEVAKMGEFEYVYKNEDTKAISQALYRGIEQARTSPRMQESIKLQDEAAVRNVQDFINERLDFIVNSPEKVNEAFWKAKDLAKESERGDRITVQREVSKAFFSDYIFKAENKAQAIENIVSLGEQFFSASGIGGGRYQFFENVSDFRNELNSVIKDMGLDLTVTDKNTIINSKGEVISKIKRFGKTQHKSDHALKLLEKSFGKDGNIDLTNPKVKENVQEVVDFYENLATESRKMLDAQMEFFMSEFKAGNIDNVDMALYTMTLKSGMGTILRMAAPLREIYNVLPGEARQMKTSVNGEKVLIWEHSKAAERFLYEMLDIYMKPKNMTNGKLNKSGKTKMQDLYKNYYVTIMPYAFDSKITKLGYQVAEPTQGTRYHNKDTFGLKESRSTTNLITGEVKGKAWAEAAMNAINPKLAKENLKSDPISFASESNTRTNVEFLDAAKNHDIALSKAKIKNKVPKKIRVFDFDDTMAKTKSLVFYNKSSRTSNVKPKLKAIVMAGTPGGGKSSVIKGLDLVKDGFKEVNQDISLEWLKSKEGLPAKEADYSKEQKSVRSKLGAQARKIAARKLDKFASQGDGIILDGTGASLKATESKIKALEDLGYEVSMIYVDTLKETAIARNKARAERSLPDFIVSKTWDAVNANKEVYAGRFGNRFYDINTEGLKQGEVPRDISEAIKTDLAATERGRLTAEEFAKEGKGLVEEGFKMDFSDFNIVREGERGPLFEVAEKIRDARGTEDIFILTARAPESAPAIREFLKSEGLDIPLENITGLGNSTGEAKAQWIVGKAAEGYNDFYFADDAVANVKAVKEALAPLDVKSKVQQAFASESEVKSIEFNKLLEQSTGIEYYKEYSAAKAKTIGASKGKFKFWIPYSAEDFQGLIYPTLAKGKLGDKQMAWYKTNLLNPYARAMDNLSRDRVQLMSDFKALKKQLDVPKDLRKKNDTGFTNEQAVRVYLYNKAGHEVPGLSKTDLRELLDVVNSDGKLQAFAEQILTLTKGDGYVKPNENWLVGTITTDLINLLNTTKRGKYLEEWQSNVDQIYSKENLNKLEAIYGPKYREALENILARMKSGKNRLASGGRLSNQILDYINGSNAAIMFFNTRSAVLQTISSINFVNWSFNNPIKAGIAFANQPQYWKDFVKLMNSDYLLDRRNGLRLNIAENEIADAAATSKNKVKGALRYILEKGYLPTQYADSFAIASGGATFYRNRINDLVKKGINVKEAEAQAYLEWRQIAEESQQSSDPSKISQQQASDAGRLILMFANTPMQYARLQKRAFQDLVNGRGDAKANLSKIAYYGFVQNMMFNALQNALMKLGFDDEDNDKEKEKRYFRTANGMLDTTLRGLGIGGAAISVAKNFLLDIYERSGRKRPEYVDSMWKLLQFSPPISSKISKLRQAAWAFDSKKRREEIFSKGFSLDNPAVMAGAKVISATTNVPLDRVLQKADNIEGALSEEADWWQSTLMLGGWPRWDIMPDRDEYVSKPKTQEEKDKIKENRDKKRYEAAKTSSNYDVLKKLNKKQQIDILRNLGVGNNTIKKLRTEKDRIEYIQKRRKQKDKNKEKTNRTFPNFTPTF